MCQPRPRGLKSKAEPREQNGLTLYTLTSRLQKQKARSNAYMVIFNFIGYIILVLCDFPLPGAHVQISQVYLSAMSSLTPYYFLRTEA
jgi:hypothetical protein